MLVLNPDLCIDVPSGLKPALANSSGFRRTSKAYANHTVANQVIRICSLV